MTTAPDPSVIDRIRKLHAKAESCSAIGSLAEAEAFSSAVLKMLGKYQLDQSVLTVEDPEVVGESEKTVFTSGRKRYATWQVALIVCAASAYLCEPVFSSNGLRVTLIGRPTNREVAHYMITFLLRTAETLVKKATWDMKYKAKKSTGSFAVGSYRESWLIGFVAGLERRWLAEKGDLEQEQGMGLILRSLEQENREFINRLTGISRGKELSFKADDPRGRADGRRAAESLVLAKGLTDSVAPSRKQLGSGS